MPAVPTTAFQLFVLLIFLLPGAVFQFVRSRLRGPSPDDANALARGLRALAVSTFLGAVYLAVFGESLVRWVDWVRGQGARGTAWHWLGVWSLALLFVVPSSLAVAMQYARMHPRTLEVVRRVGRTYDPTPGAWDFAFTGRAESYVRILTHDGQYIGGWFGSNSFASSYPEPHTVYLQEVYRMSEDGTFGEAIPGSGGMFVRCDDIVLLEFC